MKKKFLFIFILLVITFSVFAQQKAKLVVPPFENRRSRLDAVNLDNLQDYLINAFINDGTFEVPDRNALATIVQEHKFQLSDWSDDKKSVEMGKLINANYIVRVIAMHDGEYFILSARILDVNTAGGLSAAEMEFSNQREARNKMADFIYEITQRIRRGTGGGAGGTTGVITSGRTSGNSKYSIGERGPAGGIIFYDKGSFSNGWQYLEVAPSETEVRAEWGAHRQDVKGTSTALGTGKQNTKLIIEHFNNNKKKPETGRAAQICVNLNFDGFNDWFLPSKDELDLMYKNLKEKNLGNFDNSQYWSSSQDHKTGVTTLEFKKGDKASRNKFDKYLVRAIRAF